MNNKKLKKIIQIKIKFKLLTKFLIQTIIKPKKEKNQKKTSMK